MAKFNPTRWKHLSDQQAAVVQWTIEGTGSLELLARAGCGKTYTLMQVVEAIKENHLGDCAIMAYNKSIADEIKGKLEAKNIDWKTAQAGTVHSFGFSAFRKLAPNVQVDEKKVNNIIQKLVNPNPMESCVYRQEEYAITKLVSLAKQRAFGHLVKVNDNDAWVDIWDHFGLEDEVSEDADMYTILRAAQNVFKISMDQCREVIDFDDMILAPLVYRAKFWPKDWVLVDESQDTNPARRALALALLKPRTGRMIFVGDPAQAIYGFTGADSDSMNQLKAATQAITLPLNVTRRCPKLVVEEAKRMVPDFVAHEEAIQGVVRGIEYAELEKEGLSVKDVILCRNTAPLIETAYDLINKGIACRVEGREIGQGLVKLARRWKIKTLDALLNKLADHEQRQTAKYMSRGQEEKIDAMTDQLQCLRTVISRCLTKKINTVDGLVAEVESMFGNTRDGETPKVLTLSTVHKSKGREWKRVFLLGRAKYMPSPYARKPWQKEQEANLEYVAVTRAAEELIDVSVAAKAK